MSYLTESKKARVNIVTKFFKLKLKIDQMVTYTEIVQLWHLVYSFVIGTIGCLIKNCSNKQQVKSTKERQQQTISLNYDIHLNKFYIIHK